MYCRFPSWAQWKKFHIGLQFAREHRIGMNWLAKFLIGTQIVELGNLVVNLCNAIPNGLVVFFASYAYQNQVHTVWEEKGIHRRIELKKQVNPSVA